jgi:hypothetical protein
MIASALAPRAAGTLAPTALLDCGGVPYPPGRPATPQQGLP